MTAALDWTPEYRVGTLRTKPPMRLAEDCARWIVQCDGPMAVCADPKGVVTVERPEDAFDGDLLGVYAPELGRFELYRLIRDELREARKALGVRP